MADLKRALELKEEIEKKGGSLIAVSKKFSVKDIEEVNTIGIENFGENYVSEALEKIESLKSLNLKWHFIGRVQSGNLNKLIDNFYLIHSIYKLEHLRKINERTLKKQKILLQLQHDKDDRGFGLSKPEIFKILEDAQDFDNIDLTGLMFMPPPDFDREDLEKAFKWAREAFLEMKNKTPESHSWDTLSMGMSGDYDLALQMGSTHVRIGTAIFGTRS